MLRTNVEADPSGRLDWLDALRGWAIAGVVLVHSGQVAHSVGLAKKVADAGQYGVQLFFVISALTIGMTYDAHIARYGKQWRSQLGWFVKRFFRIAPLYYLAAAIYPLEQALIYVASGHQYGRLPHLLDILANLLFVHTWVPAANNTVVPGGWSIGVEMFFYALVPLVWSVPSANRIKTLALCAVGGVLITFVTNYSATGSFYVHDNSYFYYWFPAQAPVIIVGLVLYFKCGERLRDKARKNPAKPSFLLSFLVFAVAGVLIGTGYEVASNIAAVVLAVSFVFLILSLGGAIKMVVANPWMVWLGRISYSVYIVHFVVLDGVRATFIGLHIHRYGPYMLLFVFMLVIGIAIVLAWASRKLIEEPGNAYGHRLSARLSVAASQEVVDA